MLSKEQLESYERDGYIIVKHLFDKEEIDMLSKTARQDREMDKKSFGKADAGGGTIRLSLWNHPGNGIYGMFARSKRIVNAVEQLLHGEVYHYHSKMILKDAKVGGAWEWHQDYGYWYENGVLFPELCSVFIAVDPATKENGCLQVLKRSHQMGRIDHGKTGDQAGADLDRVNEAMKVLDLVYCEMAPGDVLFFHPNLLHKSDQNHSDNPRWSMICCYNSATNNPYKETHHPRYTKLHKVDDSAIREVGMKPATEDVDWLKPEEDLSVKS